MHITSAVIQIKVISRFVMRFGFRYLFFPDKGIAVASLQQYHFLFIRNKLHYNACLVELKFMLRGGLKRKPRLPRSLQINHRYLLCRKI